MSKVKLASLLGVALTFSSASVTAGVEYEDTDLHRSDDMVRFDRAYRTGLKDGTTTIIYSDSKDTEEAPEQSGTVRERRPVPEESRYPGTAERREYPSQGGAGDGSRIDDCECDPAKPTAPRSERVTPSVAAEPEPEATMREKLEAVRKARELLRKSRDESAVADSKNAKSSDDQEKGFAGTGAPRLIDHAKSPSIDQAPLTPYELDPDFVRNQEVSVDIAAATIEEIATELMPRGWRVRLSTADQEVHESKYEFVSSDPREVALRKLLLGTGLGYKMFFNLKDDEGNPSPLLVISEVNS